MGYTAVLFFLIEQSLSVHKYSTYQTQVVMDLLNPNL